MNDQLDGQIRSLLARIDEAAPLAPSFESLESLAGPHETFSRRGVGIAALALVGVGLLGVYGIAELRADRPDADGEPAPAPVVSSSLDAAPSTTGPPPDDSSGVNTTTTSPCEFCTVTLPLVPGVGDFYAGPESLGEPSIDMSTFATIVRCTELDPDATRCAAIEGMAGVGPLTYPSADGTVDVGTTWAEVTPLEYAESWGPTQGDGPTSPTTVRGHDAIRYLDEDRPALVWQERPGVLVWVAVSANREDELTTIAENIRLMPGPDSIPWALVVPGTGERYDASDNNGDGLLVVRDGARECFGWGYVIACSDAPFSNTFMHELDGRRTVTGVVPPDVERVRLSFPAGNSIEVEPFAVNGITMHVFEVEIGDAYVIGMEWLDGDGTVVASTTSAANTLLRSEFNLSAYVESIVPEYPVTAAESSSPLVVVRSPTSDQEFIIQFPTDSIATPNPPGISQTPDGTYVLADVNGETIFALTISTYPDACTTGPDCTPPDAAEQMDAIFAALAAPLSP
jgi:hypothetical protein